MMETPVVGPEALVTASGAEKRKFYSVKAIYRRRREH